MNSEVEHWALTHALHTFKWTLVVLYFFIYGLDTLNNSANFTQKFSLKKEIKLFTRDKISL